MTALSEYFRGRPKVAIGFGIALVVTQLALLLLVAYWRYERGWVYEILGFKAFLGPPFFEYETLDLEGDGDSFRQYELSPRLIEAFEQRASRPDSFPVSGGHDWQCSRWSPTPYDRAAKPAIDFALGDTSQEAGDNVRERLVHQRLSEPHSWYAYCVKELPVDSMAGAEVFLLDTKYRVLTYAYSRPY